MLLKPFLCVLLFSCFVSMFPVTVLAEAEEHHAIDLTSGGFWGQIVAIFFLVILSGIVAGLTLGLMSLDTTNLAILEIAGTPQQKEYASRIIPIRKNGHILLTTLLLTNTVLNETLPILFDGIFSTGFISVIVSTALLVMFSEIIPQAIFSKHGLAIGALFAYPVRILIGMWFIISWPISKFLDYLLGTHTGFTYGVSEFGALVQLHDTSKYPDGTLKHKTVTVLQNVLTMQEKYADQIITSASNMLMLKPDVILMPSKVQQYISSGYSYIIVYEDTTVAQTNDYQVLGVLKLKSLNILESKDLNEPIGRMKLDTYLTASSRELVIDLMNPLLSHESDAEVVLIYRTEQDIKVIKEENDAAAREIASIRTKALNKHKNSLPCRVRRLFGSSCHLCHPLSCPSESDISEEETISSGRSLNTNLKAGLIGMVTKKEILNQLVCPKVEPKDKSVSFQAVHVSLKASQN